MSRAENQENYLETGEKMPSYESIRLINTILTLYYVEGLTQTEIAQRLGLSTAKVNRLLVQAREQGYVNITIRTPFQQLIRTGRPLESCLWAEGSNRYSFRGGEQQLTLNAARNRGSRLFAEPVCGMAMCWASRPAQRSRLSCRRLRPRVHIRSSRARPGADPGPDRIRHELSGDEPGGETGRKAYPTSRTSVWRHPGTW